MDDYPEWMLDPERRIGRLGSLQQGYGCARHVQDKHLGVRASEIQRENVDWLWPGRIALGKITILDGDPGVGKSTITCDIAAALTARGHLPCGHRLQTGVGVVLVNAEDSAADTIVPRLTAAGADLERCMIANDVGGGGRLVLPDDLDRLNSAVESVRAKLVVVDPLFAHLPEKRNSWNDQHMREVLTPLKVWAEQMGVAVKLVRHPNKGKEMKALYRGGGSIGIIGAARFGLFAAVHPDDPDLRVLSSSKCNIGRKPSSLAFRIVESDANPEVGVVEWEGELDLTANDLVGYGRPTRDREIDRAERFLMKLLAAGPLAANDVYERSREAKFADRTLHRAKDKLGIKPRLRFQGDNKHWYWELSTEPDYSTNGVATDVPF